MTVLVLSFFHAFIARAEGLRLWKNDRVSINLALGVLPVLLILQLPQLDYPVVGCEELRAVRFRLVQKLECVYFFIHFYAF